MATAQNPSLISHLSPFGDILASAEGNSKIILTRVKTGATFGVIDFGPNRRISCLVWATNTCLVIGNHVGEVSQADLTYYAAEDSPKFAKLSLVTRSHYPIKAMCFDVSDYLLAISFDGNIQIWCGRLTNEHRREWALYDMVSCQHNGAAWSASTMTFFSTDNKSLFAATDAGFGIWVYSDRSFWWYERTNLPAIKHCAVSPNGRTLAVSTKDLSILIWPLAASGPASTQPRTFEIPIPVGQSWMSKVDVSPVNFLNTELIVTTDLVGTVYVISLDGQMQSTISIGENYFIKSIWASTVHRTTAQVIALGAHGNPLIIGCANSHESQRSILAITEFERPLTPWPRARIQNVTTELEIGGGPVGTADVVIQAHLRRLDWLKLAMAIAHVGYWRYYVRNQDLDFSIVWIVPLRLAQYIWLEMLTDELEPALDFIGVAILYLIVPLSFF
ncbi:hypothetical protein FRC06_006903 [Ceratobasidium sp. 370]|nr:hypothetical protein FRC06_006903 [Ceratobasidium sp. 370]